MPTKSEAIKRFLMAKAPKDLAEAYSLEMECQVNVAQDAGERVEGDYQGRQWHGWTNGLETWKSFRIPYNANSEPTYEDKEMSFDLVNHAEGIGMTGWNWKKRVSKWVAYDFDAILGHSEKHNKKLSPAELEEVTKAASQIEWVTLRKSTSSKGLHLYVYLNDFPTANHTEHAALARAILGKLSAITGYDFQSKVDNCGGNMWIWHRKKEGTTGLEVIKRGSIFADIPPNWRDHMKVVSGKRRKVEIPDVEDINNFEELVGQLNHVKLDEDHKRLITYLQEKEAYFWWDADHHMLVGHTKDCEEAHISLDMKGIFKTNSLGTDRNEQNCFLIPLRHGAWVVRRFTPGVEEDISWEQDGQGWTKCYLNKIPDVKAAAISAGGLENEKGEFIFPHAELAQNAALMLKANIKLPNWALGRQATIKKHKDGKRIVFEMDHEQRDSMAQGLEGWLLDKGKWKRIYDIIYSDPQEMEATHLDDVSRHLVTEGLDDAGWVIRTGNEWKQEPFHHIKVALESMGLKSGEVRGILGASIFKPWKIVNRPFQPEYIGDRQWNRNAPQFRFAPNPNRDNLSYPTWLKILNHIGKNLDEAIHNNGWAKANGILTGADYLKCWIASMFQEPLEPLPYLFIFGPQNCGKSIYHEALELLMSGGYVRADTALKSGSGFNGELKNAVLCVIEETNLTKQKQAELRIKDWVTSRMLPIHEKRGTPYLIPNTTKWVQIANDYTYCPVFPGDTRITMFYVDLLNPMELIPKKVILPLLEKEAPDFLAACLNLELPNSNDRLNIPVIITEEKRRLQQENRTLLEVFVEDYCYYVPGKVVKFSILYERFKEWLDPSDVTEWTKVRFGQYFSANSRKFPKGRSNKTGQWYIGNIDTKAPIETDEKRKITLRGEMLVHISGEGISHD